MVKSKPVARSTANFGMGTFPGASSNFGMGSSSSGNSNPYGYGSSAFNQGSGSNYGIPKPGMMTAGQAWNAMQADNSSQIAANNRQILALKSAAKSVLEVANFNSYIKTIGMRRDVDALQRQGSRLLSAQQAAIGASGFSQGSKSFLMVANETFGEVQDKLNETRYDFYQQNAADLFEAKQQNRALRMQQMEKSIETFMLGLSRGGKIKKSQSIQF